MAQKTANKDPEAQVPKTVKPCCLNCGYAKSLTGHAERQCICPGGPREGRMVSLRSRCGKHERWRPGFHVAGARPRSYGGFGDRAYDIIED